MADIEVIWKDGGKKTFSNCGYVVGNKKGQKGKGKENAYLKLFKKGSGKGSKPFRQYKLSKIDTWRVIK